MSIRGRVLVGKVGKLNWNCLFFTRQGDLLTDYLQSPPRCTVPSSSAANTCTTSPSTTVTSVATRTCLPTSPPLSVLRRVTLLPLASAVLSARLYVHLVILVNFRHCWQNHTLLHYCRTSNLTAYFVCYGHDD